MTFEEAGASSLEQFTLLAKNARGRACVALIQQALTNKKLYVFRELLEMPNVQSLRGTEHDEYLQLLEIFSYGKYTDYLAKKHELPALTPQQIQKLRKLTALTLAQQSKIVPYTVLMKELDVASIRELEDVLIETIYSGLVQGKLDQKSQSLVVKFAVGRDTQDTDLDLMIQKLTSWKDEASNICARINEILSQADALAESEKAREEHIRVKNLRTLNERSKTSLSGGNPSGSGNFRPEDFAIPDLHGGPRRGPMPKRVAGNMGRKGRI